MTLPRENGNSCAAISRHIESSLRPLRPALRLYKTHTQIPKHQDQKSPLPPPHNHGKVLVTYLFRNFAKGDFQSHNCHGQLKKAWEVKDQR
jgi:hypothetical protein